MEQGVLPYQGSSTPTFQKEEELFPAKEQNFTNMDENKKMRSLHEHKFLDLDTFQVNTSAILKKIEAQIGHLVQAFKDQFSRTSPGNTSKNLIECIQGLFGYNSSKLFFVLQNKKNKKHKENAFDSQFLLF